MIFIVAAKIFFSFTPKHMDSWGITHALTENSKKKTKKNTTTKNSIDKRQVLRTTRAIGLGLFDIKAICQPIQIKYDLLPLCHDLRF